MKIAMIGSGYVGLVSGACFADFGHDVMCVDKDASKIEALENGRMPIFEPGLDQIVASNVRAGRLSFTTDLAAGVAGADAVFIAVGTPSRRGDGHADLSYVYAAAREIAEAADGPCVVVTKSTVPVGTGDEVEAILKESRPEYAWTVVSNPEFLREGAAISDFKRPDRIVVGTEDRHAQDVMRDIYRPLYLNAAPILFTGRRTAELIKYAANAFLATKIGFINELADLAERVGADVKDVSRGIGLDNRIGSKFLHAGPGYGGSCFPKDVRALIRTASENHFQAGILEAVESRNTSQKRILVEKIRRRFGEDLSGRTFALWGLAFKPNTDDMREAPASVVMEMLWAAGARVRAFDPVAMKECRRIHGARIEAGALTLADSKEEALRDCDALVICTEWKAFLAPDFAAIRRSLKVPAVFDGRNIYDPRTIARHGLEYHGIGRGRPAPAPARAGR